MARDRLEVEIVLSDKLSAQLKTIAAKIKQVGDAIVRSFSGITKQADLLNRRLSAVAQNMDKELGKSFVSINAQADLFNEKLNKIGTTVGLTGAQSQTAAKKMGLIAGFFHNLRQVKPSEAIKDISAGFFRFRESFGEIQKPLNQFVNGVARVVRGMARIRTAVFLLVTAFAVRPIVRFFKELAERTAESREALREVRERMTFILDNLSRQLAPFFKKFSEGLIGLIESFGDFIEKTPEQFDALTNAVVEVGNTAVQTIKIVGSAASGLFSVIHTGIRGVLSVFAEVNLGILKGVGLIEEEYPGAFAKVSNEFNRFIDKLVLGTAAFFKTAGSPAAVEQAFRDVDEMADRLIGKAPDFSNIINEAIKSAREQAEGNLKNLDTSIENLGKTAKLSFESIKNSFASIFTATPFIDAIKDALKKAGRLFPQIIRDSKDETIRAYSDIQEGVLAALQKFRDRTQREIFDKLTSGIAESFEQNLGDTFVLAFEQRFSKMREVAANFLKDIQKEIGRFLASQVVKQLFGNIGFSFLSNLFGGFRPTQTVSGPPGTPIPSTGPLPSEAVVGPAPRQHGGIEFGRRSVTVGEAGPEAIIPLRKGKVPVQLTGNQRTVNVNFTINAVDGASVSAMLRREASTIKRIMIEAARGRDSAIRQSFKLDSL